MTNGFGDLAKAQYISLTTFKKDGTPRATPVWFAQDGEKLVVWSETNAWKVKRARRNPDVLVQKCDMRGKTTGDVAKGSAEVLDEQASERVRQLIMKKYGIIGLLTVKFSTLRRGKNGTIGIAIAPA